MEALRALNRVSLEIYATHRADLKTEFVNKDEMTKHFGDTWEAELKASDDHTKQLEQVIRVLEQRVPSDTMNESTQMNRALKKVE
jgi:DNA recombination-dependent growth factor C